MAFGLQVYDAAGLITTTTNLPRILGSTYQNFNGSSSYNYNNSITDNGFLTGIPFWIFTPVNSGRPGSFSASLSGNVLSYNWTLTKCSTGDGVGFRVLYGVR